MNGAALLLIGAVAAVGVLHTIVPDHWLPIALIARERGWSKRETARAALQAGTGHILSTLLIALAVWVAGLAFANRFGHVVDVASSLALIGFGGGIAISAWGELHHIEGAERRHEHSHVHGAEHPHAHSHGPSHFHGAKHAWPGIATMTASGHALAIGDDPLYAPIRGDTAVLTRHLHLHCHGRGPAHLHWHDHPPATDHPVLAAFASEPPLHRHRHKTTARTSLLLILGSSPMVEGIPAFFAAAKFGVGIISVMAVVFALSTIATYVVLCVYSTAGLQRLRLGAFEIYGEVLSGAVIAGTGVIFGLWPSL